MMRLLQWLFIGHVHKWKTIEQHNVLRTGDTVVGKVFVQQCEHCGAIRSTRVRAGL